MNDSKACLTCKQVKLKSEFHNRPASKDGLHYHCKDCRRIERNIWRKKNAEKVAASKRNWYQRHRTERLAYTAAFRAKNPFYRKDYRHRKREVENARSLERRAFIMNSPYLVTNQDYVALLRKPCVYCGLKSEHVDHVVPISKGGRHSIGNLAPACAKCNLTKGARFISEWKKVRGW